MKLEGFRVIDLSTFVPGPRLTMSMADHGADVIKIEAHPDGDPARQSTYTASSADVGNAGEMPELFRRNNRGKRSLRLDLKDPRGRAILLRLCETADVLVESFRPGVMQRLGLDYASVAACSPGIVYCSLSAFGQDGPYRLKPAHDRAAQAMAGTLTITTGADGAPIVPEGVPAAVMAGSLTALNAVLMALLRRARTGRGDCIDIAMVDALMFWNSRSADSVAGAHDAAGQAAALRSVYETADRRFIMLGGSEPHFARNLLDKAGRPELAPLCSSPPGPAQAPVKEFLRDFFHTKTLAETQQWFADIDVAWAPVRTFHEVLTDPSTRERGMVLDGADGKRHIGTPIKFAMEPALPRLESPLLGQHAPDILIELGYSRIEIDALAASGVI